MRAAAAKAGMSYSTAIAKEHGMKTADGDGYRQARLEPADITPKSRDQLCPEALRALDDIAYFARRYFGLILMPWQQEATETIVRLQGTDTEEYCVINVAPGTGKSTFFTLVLPAWVTCRDRTIRGMIGSASANTGSWYTGRLRTALSRTYPVKAKPKDLQQGIAVDAEAVLVEDYGTFKPDFGEEVWRNDAFCVAQHDNVAVSEKEPTWMSFGRTSTFLGARVDLCIWDDVYDPAQNRTVDARTDLKNWWSDIAETRLEPGGLLILQGQRISSDDIYHYALGLKNPPPEFDDDEEEYDEADGVAKYTHIKFKAHYEDRCKGHETHKLSSPAYPEGCLLYPRRLPWRKLQAIKSNTPTKFEILYQQEDVDVRGALVHPAWIWGGTDADGVEAPGCVDRDRGLCELPKNLAGPLISYATVDPSPSKMWAIQWWVYSEPTKFRYLMDLERRSMTADEFLDYRANEGVFYGLMHEWQLRSIELGLPITTWIVENNAAQRFLLAYDHMRRWRALYGVDVIAHATTSRKLDEDYGPQILRSIYRFGQVRLPMRSDNRGSMKSLKLIDEVTRWTPEDPGGTDDEVMAQWFGEVYLPNLISEGDPPPCRWVPSWLNKRIA